MLNIIVLVLLLSACQHGCRLTQLITGMFMFLSSTGVCCLKMSVNYSSSTNFSLDVPRSPDSCLGAEILITFSFTNIIFLLPLSILVLNLGFQRWKQQRSVSSAVVMSFSDFFTYNMAVMELFGVFGCIMYICSKYFHLSWLAGMSTFMLIFPWSGQMCFPILTCLDRYVAVVYPITYRRLKQVAGLYIRNISTGFVWLQCFATVPFYSLTTNNRSVFLTTAVCLMSVLLIAVTFSSLSILHVLIRPRPGEVGRNGARIDKSKRRAFHMIIIIMGVLWLRFGGALVCNVVLVSPGVSPGVQCVVGAAQVWFNVPSSLVLPLLFLHRAGKLPGCKHNTESG